MHDRFSRACHAAGAALLLLSVPAAAHVPTRPPQISPLPPTPVMAQAAAGLARPYGGTPIDVLGYHYDNNRTGWNPTETDLTPASVAGGKFGLLATLKVDGNVFAQPLLVHAFTMPDGSVHDVLIVATGHNSVYAFDAQTYSILWQVNLGPSQSTADVGCNDVKPEYDISGTPVIVRSAANAATIYLVAATEPARFTFQSQLHALNVSTGADVTPPVLIAPAAKLSDGSTVAFDPQDQWNRAGLAYNNGSIYIGIGSHCDNGGGSTTGWLLAYDTALVPQAAFNTIFTPNTASGDLASIWMSGFAPAVDSAGNVYVVSGNGGTLANKVKRDWGESVLRLPGNLAGVSQSFTPASYMSLNTGDLDFGSGGVMLVPAAKGQTGPQLAVASGKEAVIYLLNRSRLGGLKPNNSGALQAVPVGTAGEGVRGGPAYYAGPAAPTVYLQIDHDVLRSYALTTGATPRLTAGATGTVEGGYGGSLPIVSSNGAAANTGVVWLLHRSLPMQLEAYDAVKLGAPLYAANAGTWSNTAQANPFLTVMEANGRVYVPAYKTVDVFGLTP